MPRSPSHTCRCDTEGRRRASAHVPPEKLGGTRNDTPFVEPHQNSLGLLLHAQEVKAADAKVPRATSSARVAATVEVAPDHTGRLPMPPAPLVVVMTTTPRFQEI